MPKFSRLVTSSCPDCGEWGGGGKILSPDDAEKYLSVTWACGRKVEIDAEGEERVILECSKRSLQ